ncbi:MAG: hypothetical protein VYE64_06610 [Planctomycetota bacterium]|nr:hypothetical protein [Planctomycetota bacterium]
MNSFLEVSSRKRVADRRTEISYRYQNLLDYTILSERETSAGQMVGPASLLFSVVE